MKAFMKENVMLGQISYSVNLIPYTGLLYPELPFLFTYFLLKSIQPVVARKKNHFIYSTMAKKQGLSSSCFFDNSSTFKMPFCS